MLAALLERSKSAKTEAHAKVDQPAPCFRASNKGKTCYVVAVPTAPCRASPIANR